MKLISFAVETMRSNKEHDIEVGRGYHDNKKFYHFLYFLFAPTMIYRDQYPKSDEGISISGIAVHLLELLSSGYAVICVVEFFVIPTFSKTSIQVQDLPWIIAFSFCSAFIVVCFIGIGVLHCCTNIQAELMNFGDRCFYREYWTSTNPLSVMTSWNVFIQDWIFEYPYQLLSLKIIAILISPRNQINKLLSCVVIFMGSAMVHDYAIAVIFGFWTPVFLVTFGAAAAIQLIAFEAFRSLGFINDYNFLNRLFTQITFMCFWAGWIIFYSLEHFSRINCPTQGLHSLDFLSKEFLYQLFIPSSLSCVHFRYN